MFSFPTFLVIHSFHWKLQMKNLENPNASSTSTTPTLTNASTSNINPTSTIIGPIIGSKGRQSQVFTSRKK